MRGAFYHGHDGIRRYVKDLNDAWDLLSSEIDDTIGVGHLVVAIGELRYRGKGSGVESRSPAGYMIKFRRGRVVYMRAFRDPEQALEAVGLRE